jgi:hypothetical protein
VTLRIPLKTARIKRWDDVFVLILQICIDFVSQGSEVLMASRMFIARALEESARMRRETGKM